MFIRKKKVREKFNILTYSIENLSRILEEGNFIELSYILGNKKEIIKRNLLAGIFRGIGIRNRCYCYYCYANYFTSKNCYFKYSRYRWVYCWYCWNSWTKQIKIKNLPKGTTLFGRFFIFLIYEILFYLFSRLQNLAQSLY